MTTSPDFSPSVPDFFSVRSAYLLTIPEVSHIPVVFLTGVTEKETVVKTLVELKPQGYIVKPSKKSELVAKIIDILG